MICNHCDSLYSSFSDGIHCDVCVRMSKPIVKVLGYKIIIPKEEPKQEPLEEAAERYWVKQPYNEDAFIEGAKWQQQNSYSEEEVKTIASNLFYNMANSEKGIIHTYESFDKWFEQFKKK